MSSFRGSSAQLWLSTLIRLGLAGVLLWSGGAKVSEPQQAVMAVQAYEILPVQLGEFVGYALPLFELALGVALLLGVATRISAVVAGALMTAFVVGVASAWARGLSIDCGCFGGGGQVPEGEANYLPVLLRDLGFTLMAGWLVVFPASRWSLDRSGRAGTGDFGLYDDFETRDEARDEDWDEDWDESQDDERQAAGAERPEVLADTHEHPDRAEERQ